MIRSNLYFGGTAAVEDRLLFGDLLEMLRNEGFSIDMDDYVDFIAVYQQLALDTPDLLPYYLAPLICKNEDEQTRFYQVYDRYCRGSRQAAVLERGKKRRFRWLIVAGAMLCLMLTAIFYYWRMANRQIVIPSTPHLCLTVTGSGRAGSPLQFSAFCPPVPQDSTAHTDGPQPEWDFGDGSKGSGARVSHVYARAGVYPVKCRLNAKDDGIEKDSLLQICPPSLKIQVEQAVRYTGETIRLRIDSLEDNNTYWSVEKDGADSIQTRQNTDNSFKYTFPSQGHYTVALHYEGTNCTGGSVDVDIADKNEYQLSPRLAATPMQQVMQTSNRWKMAVPLAVALLTFFTWSSIRKKKKNIAVISSATLNFDGDKGPVEIPFQSRDQHIVRMAAITRIAYDLQRRTAAEVPFLDVPATIAKTCRNYGIFDPSWRLKDRPREYLVLIEQDLAENQQIYLFLYLLRSFKADNVLIDLYFFHGTPDNFFKPGDPQTLPVSYLRDMHHGAILIVVGKGYSLIDQALPLVDATQRAELGWWDKRVLLTPVPVRDWSANETILGSFFNMVSADIEGLLHLSKFITEEAAIGDAGVRREEDSIEITGDETSSRNISEIGQLKAYLHDEDLFQWFSALAIHHRIRWEITIELGRQILAANNAVHKLNYANLLKFARLQWMENGAFPSGLRIELLKGLSERNELIARNTMLQLLAESDSIIGPDSFSYEEKQVQRFTDSFVLFANDPVLHEGLKDDAGHFLQLWKKRQIADIGHAVYLKNEKEEWTTPVKSPADSRHHVGVDKYLEVTAGIKEAERRKTQRRPPWVYYLFSIVYLLLVALQFVLVLVPAQTLARLAICRELQMVALSFPEKIDVSLYLEGSACLRTANTHRQPSIMSLQTDGSVYSARGVIQPRITGVARDSAIADSSILFVFKNVGFQELYSANPVFILDSPALGSGFIHEMPARFSTYGLSFSGIGCKPADHQVVIPQDSNAQLVYIQASPGIDTAQLENFRRFLTSRGYNVPEIDTKPYKGVNEVRYPVPALKAAADSLARVCTAYFNKKMAATLIKDHPVPDVSKGELEIWLMNLPGIPQTVGSLPATQYTSAGQTTQTTQRTQTISSTDFNKLVNGDFVDAQGNELDFSAESLTIRNASDNGSSQFLITPNVRKRNDTLVIFIMRPQDQADPASFFQDSVILKVVNRTILKVLASNRYKIPASWYHNTSIATDKKLLWITDNRVGDSSVLKKIVGWKVQVTSFDFDQSQIDRYKDSQFDMIVFPVGKVLTLSGALTRTKMLVEYDPTGKGTPSKSLKYARRWVKSEKELLETVFNQLFLN